MKRIVTSIPDNWWTSGVSGALNATVEERGAAVSDSPAEEHFDPVSGQEKTLRPAAAETTMSRPGRVDRHAWPTARTVSSSCAGVATLPSVFAFSYPFRPPSCAGSCDQQSSCQCTNNEVDRVQHCTAERRISLKTQEAFLYPTVLPVGAGPFRTASASLFSLSSFFFRAAVLLFCASLAVRSLLERLARGRYVNRWGSPDVGTTTVLAPRTGQGVRFLM